MIKKLHYIFIGLGLLFLTLLTVCAQADVQTSDYEEQLLTVLNQYGDDFDDCFPELPSDFPTLPNNYTDLNDRINEVSENTWYHRTIPIPYGAGDEIFFHMKTEMTHYAIDIKYTFIESEKRFVISAINFFDDLEGTAGGEFWNGYAIPSGVAENSLKEIDVCKGTPGFMFISFILAIAIVLIGYSRYKKV
jgi:hypothetical protein